MVIGVIGGGNMAQAIVGGCLRSVAVGADEWLVADPDEGKREMFRAMGVRSVGSGGELMELLGSGDAVLLAVKPQSLGEVAVEVGENVAGRLVMSILAGTGLMKLDRLLGGGGRVVRAMPNTPARIGLGMTALSGGSGVSEGDMEVAERVFGGVGETVRLDEQQMDAFTGVAGSGPAYVFLMVEAMARGGEMAGLDRDVALESARRTVIGAAGLLEGGADPGELRRAVTSKRGTTAAALDVLDREAFMDLIAEAVVAARDRGLALDAEGD